jgi:hypothetical protein
MSKAPVSLDLPTLRFYAGSAQVYCASGPGGVSRNLHSFLPMLQPGARIRVKVGFFVPIDVDQF